jgi:translation initiation factor IF-2
VRDGTVIYDTTLSSLKRFKDDVREVAAGYECGMALEGYQDIKEGDVIQAFEVQEVAR